MGKSQAELREEVRRLKADIRRIRSEEHLGAEVRKLHHRRAKVRFGQLVGKYRRAGKHFKDAVKLAKKEYRKHSK